LTSTLVMVILECLNEILFFSKFPITAPSLAYLSNLARDTQNQSWFLCLQLLSLTAKADNVGNDTKTELL
jgi:hypothetical protein